MRKRYVLGFAFSENSDIVVLIRKNHPEWQAGLLNGVGGMVEGDESYEHAMAREFQEETGVLTREQDWKRLGDMGNNSWECTVFYLRSNYVLDHVKTVTDEEIVLRMVGSLADFEVINNLLWWLNASVDHARGPNFTLHAEYTN